MSNEKKLCSFRVDKDLIDQFNTRYSGILSDFLRKSLQKALVSRNYFDLVFFENEITFKEKFPFFKEK